MTPPGAARSHGRLAGPWESSGGRHFCGRLAPQGGLGKGRGGGGRAAGAEPRSPRSGSLPRPPQRSAATQRGVGDWAEPEPGPQQSVLRVSGDPSPAPAAPGQQSWVLTALGLQRGWGVCDREAEAAVTMAAGAQGSRQRMRLCPCLPQRGFQGSAATRGGEVKGQLSRQQQPPPSPSSSCSAWGGATGGRVEPRPGGRGGAANQLASSSKTERVGHRPVPG